MSRVRLTLSSGLPVLPCQILSSRFRATAPLTGLMVRVKKSTPLALPVMTLPT
ncbi:hypothetical protein D3C84_1210030 [compost metagenome]